MAASYGIDTSILVRLVTGVGAGLFDRLIADDYQRRGLVTLALDRKMAALSEARLLK